MLALPTLAADGRLGDQLTNNRLAHTDSINQPRGTIAPACTAPPCTALPTGPTLDKDLAASALALSAQIRAAVHKYAIVALPQHTRETLLLELAATRGAHHKRSASASSHVKTSAAKSHRRHSVATKADAAAAEATSAKDSLVEVAAVEPAQAKQQQRPQPNSAVFAYEVDG